MRNKSSRKTAGHITRRVSSTMRFAPELKDALAKAAAADERTATSLAARILGDWLREREWLK